MKVLLLVFLTSFAFTGCTKQDTQKTTMKEELLHAFENARIIGLDVRTLAEIKENPSHSSLHIPIDQLKDSAKLPKNKNQTIYVFCEAGGRAEKAKEMLKKIGYTKVENFGDWRSWNKLLDTKDSQKL